MRGPCGAAVIRDSELGVRRNIEATQARKVIAAVEICAVGLAVEIFVCAGFVGTNLLSAQFGDLGNGGIGERAPRVRWERAPVGGSR